MRPSSQLSLELTRAGDTSVVVARGDIDLSTLPRATSMLAAAREGAAAVLLDLRDVGFMDTSGLRLIIDEQRQAAARGYRFAVVRGPRRVQHLLEIAGFADDDALFVDAPASLPGGGD